MIKTSASQAQKTQIPTRGKLRNMVQLRTNPRTSSQRNGFPPRALPEDVLGRHHTYNSHHQSACWCWRSGMISPPTWIILRIALETSSAKSLSGAVSHFFYRHFGVSETKRDKLNGANGSLQNSAVSCRFLRNSAVSCGFLRNSAPPQRFNSRRSENQQKFMEKLLIWLRLSLLACQHLSSLCPNASIA